MVLYTVQTKQYCMLHDASKTFLKYTTRLHPISCVLYMMCKSLLQHARNTKCISSVHTVSCKIIDTLCEDKKGYGKKCCCN